MSAPVTFLWHDGTAEEAARFYTALIPNSVMGGVMRAPSDTPGQSEGDVLTVDFTLNGEDRAAAKRVFDAMLRMTKIDLATIEAAAAGDPS
ncbi:MAG: VOC family protein [Pseudomonadota bacterium]